MNSKLWLCMFFSFTNLFFTASAEEPQIEVIVSGTNSLPTVAEWQDCEKSEINISVLEIFESVTNNVVIGSLCLGVRGEAYVWLSSDESPLYCITLSKYEDRLGRDTCSLFAYHLRDKGGAAEPLKKQFKTTTVSTGLVTHAVTRPVRLTVRQAIYALLLNDKGGLNKFVKERIIVDFSSVCLSDSPSGCEVTGMMTCNDMYNFSFTVYINKESGFLSCKDLKIKKLTDEELALLNVRNSL